MVNPLEEERVGGLGVERGEEVELFFDWFTKYGIVEYDCINICGDVYMAFSNCPQALSTENTGAWSENGRSVEQGKEAIQWAKLGNLL